MTDPIPTGLNFDDLPTLRKLATLARSVAAYGMTHVEDPVLRQMLETMQAYTADFIEMLLDSLEVFELEEMFEQ